jgi:1-deoxy-D-xylulose-5-phosphate reductoisomerase
VTDVVLLGSTGSIGTQAIDVIERSPDRFRVRAIAAGGSDLQLLADQAARLRVRAVGVGRADAADELRERLAAVWPGDVPEPAVVAGQHATTELAAADCDVVLNGVAGSQGLRATLAALDAGRVVALANRSR